MLTKMLVPGVPHCTQGPQLTQDTSRRGRGAASPFVPLGSSCSRGAGRWRAAGFPLLVLAQLRGEAVIHLLSCSQVSSKSTSHPVTVPISPTARLRCTTATRKTCTEPGEAPSQLCEVAGLWGLRARQIHPWASSSGSCPPGEAPSQRSAGVTAPGPLMLVCSSHPAPGTGAQHYHQNKGLPLDYTEKRGSNIIIS